MHILFISICFHFPKNGDDSHSLQTAKSNPDFLCNLYDFFSSVWSPSRLMHVSGRARLCQSAATRAGSRCGPTHLPPPPATLGVELHAGASRLHTLLRCTAPRETTALHVGKRGNKPRHAWTWKWLDVSVARIFESCAVCQQLRQRAEPRRRAQMVQHMGDFKYEKHVPFVQTLLFKQHNKWSVNHQFSLKIYF